MLAFDPSQKMLGRLPAPSGSDAAPAAPVQTAQAGGESEDFFHRLLDVINPLQHLPVIGTIYRAATGEHIGAVEKIAGDALYGGLWGAVSATADVAFEAVTGKSAEDTVLAWFKSDDAPTAVAKAQVQPRMAVNAPLPSATLPGLPVDDATDTRELAALTGALSAKGVDGDLATRALYAYRRSMTGTPVVASLN